MATNWQYNWDNPQGRKMVSNTIKVFEDQLSTLKLIYGDNKSALIRFLLDKYLNGQLRELEAEFRAKLRDVA